MEKVFEIYIVTNIDLISCKQILQVIENRKGKIHLLCGGLGACIDIIQVIDKGAGVVKIHDDDYVTKLLKHYGHYSSGKWISIEGLCIAGIDSKNPIQNMERISKTLPRDCAIYLVFSTYSLTSTKCGKSRFMGKELDVGLPKDIVTRFLDSIERPLIYISCSDLTNDTCICTLEKNVIYVAIPKYYQLTGLKINKKDTEISIEVAEVLRYLPGA
ncbi:MAG: hypothetical protein QW101_00710 [Ignisphaera sp.]|uniref:Uncharacterized protein n=1 Tax=Ignisphaera aggregans TaxID=334771 RepID=A0A7J3MZ46_9CREN